MGAVYLVRHGQAGTHVADYDRLSDRGRRQSAATGRALAARGVLTPRVVSGGLVRQRESARHLTEAAGWDVALEVDPGWDEFDHLHVLERHAPPDDLRAVLAGRFDAVADRLDAAVRAWWVDPDSTWPAFGRRVDDAFAAVGGGSASDVVVVTSGGVIAHLCTQLLGGTHDTRFALGQVVANGSVTVLVRGERGARLVAFNEHAHLVSGDAEVGSELLTYSLTTGTSKPA